MVAFSAELVTTFFIGIAATINPCVLPLYPGFLAYLSNKSNKVHKKSFNILSGLIVLGGVLTFMLAVGMIMAILGLSINSFISTVSPIAFIILVILGVLLIFNVDIGKFIPKPKTHFGKNPYLNAYIFGLFYGPIVIPCSGPLALTVFVYSTTITSFLGKIFLFGVFGLGFGLPLIALSVISASKGSWLIEKLNKYKAIINRIAGILIVILGLYYLIFVFRVYEWFI